MADSEISRSLSAVTRRKLLAGTAIAAVMQPVHTKSSSAASLAPGGSDVADPLLDLWREWWTAHEETVKLCRHQQQLEAKLMAEVDLPRVGINLPGQRRRVLVFAVKDLDFWVREYPEIHHLRAEKMAELALLQSRWEEADHRIGHGRAAEAEARAAKREERLMEALWATRAQSLAGVATKLDAVLCDGEWCDDCSDFPWPQIRSVLEDVIRIGRLEQFAMEAKLRSFRHS